MRQTLVAAEHPPRWHRIALAAWRALADALERANQRGDLPLGARIGLQLRMYLARSRVELLRGRARSAYRLAEQAQSKAGESKERWGRQVAMANLVWIALHARELDRARRALLRTTGRPHPRDHELAAVRAAADLVFGQLATALTRAETATRRHPDDPVGWLVLSGAARVKGDRLRAEWAAAQALSANHGYAPARVWWSELLGARGARTGLCRDRPRDSPLHRGYLSACRARRRIDRLVARPHARLSAARLDAASFPAVADLVLSRAGLPADLQHLAGRIGALRLEPGGRAARVRAVVALRAGRVEQARRYLAQALRKGFWRHRTQLLLAELLRRSKAPRRAVSQAYEEAAGFARRAGAGWFGASGGGAVRATGRCYRRPQPQTELAIIRRLGGALVPAGAAPGVVFARAVRTALRWGPPL